MPRAWLLLLTGIAAVAARAPRDATDALVFATALTLTGVILYRSPKPAAAFLWSLALLPPLTHDGLFDTAVGGMLALGAMYLLEDFPLLVALVLASGGHLAAALALTVAGVALALRSRLQHRRA